MSRKRGFPGFGEERTPEQLEKDIVELRNEVFRLESYLETASEDYPRCAECNRLRPREESGLCDDCQEMVCSDCGDGACWNCEARKCKSCNDSQECWGVGCEATFCPECVYRNELDGACRHGFCDEHAKEPCPLCPAKK